MTGESGSRRSERWLVTPTGQWLAFEPLTLCSWIHTAARQAGVTDPFVAQEVATSVWELLQQDWPERTPLGLAELRERVASLLRAFGQPTWSEALLRLAIPACPAVSLASASPERGSHAEPHVPFAQAGLNPLVGAPGWSWRSARRQAEEKLAEEMLAHYLPDPLVELHRQGCLLWHGIAHPWEVSAARVPLLPLWRPSGHGELPAGDTLIQTELAAAMPGGVRGLFEHLERLRWWIGQAAWFCSPECELAQAGVRIGEVPALVRELILAARYTGLKLVLHANTLAARPGDSEETQLFPVDNTGDWENRLASIRAALLESLLPWLGGEDIELIWHLVGPNDLGEGWRSWRQFQRAVASGKLSITWSSSPRRTTGSFRNSLRDSRRRALPPGEAVLTVVAINVVRLAERYEIAEPETLVRRLTGLIRLVAWGSRQWRERLRHRLRRFANSFLAENAPVAVYLTGLERVSAAWFNVPEGWRWLGEVLASVRRSWRESLRETGPECWLVSPSPLWLPPNAPASHAGLIPAAPITEAAIPASNWGIASEEDLARLRVWWRYYGRGYDDLEIVWVVPESALRSPEDFQSALRPWQRLTGLRRLRLCLASTQQSELFTT